MNLLKSIAASSLLLTLTSLTGCATYVPAPVAADAHPEKYREVYFIDSKPDPRDVDPRVAARLKEVGFQVAEIPYDHDKHGALSELTTKLVALARARKGKEPAVFCLVSYSSLYDQIKWRRLGFESFDIEFYDLETGKMIFNSYKTHFDNPVPENAELDFRFAEIAKAFFPGQPNPFLAKK